MEITGIDSADPIFGAPSQTPQNDLGRDAFMKLLVSQLQNQNPLSPTSNEDFIAQLAQFSSLQEMQDLNANIVGLAVLQQSNALMAQLTDSSSLIGLEVVYTDPESGEATTGIVDSVKIQDGLAVLNIDGTDIPLGSVTEVTGGSGASTDGTDGTDGAGDDAGTDGSGDSTDE